MEPQNASALLGYTNDKCPEREPATSGAATTARKPTVSMARW